MTPHKIIDIKKYYQLNTSDLLSRHNTWVDAQLAGWTVDYLSDESKRKLALIIVNHSMKLACTVPPEFVLIIEGLSKVYYKEGFDAGRKEILQIIKPKKCPKKI